MRFTFNIRRAQMFITALAALLITGVLSLVVYVVLTIPPGLSQLMHSTSLAINRYYADGIVIRYHVYEGSLVTERPERKPLPKEKPDARQ